MDITPSPEECQWYRPGQTRQPGYCTPTSFPIIVQSETISKILEVLGALSIASAACSLGLLHPNQCGVLASLGCFNPVANLIQESKPVSSCFL